MNYYAFSKPVKAYLIDNTVKPSAFGQMLNERRDQFDPAVRQALWNLTDSHDTDRLASMVVNRNLSESYVNPANFDYDEASKNSPRRNDRYQVRKPNDDEHAIQRMVILFQLTYVGAPMFYHGVEAGIWGGDDPDCRKPMPWPDLKMEMEAADPLGRTRAADDPNFDAELHGFFAEAVALHAANSAFKSADFSVLAADDDKNVFIFSRGAGDEQRVVAMNRSAEAQTVTFNGPGSEVIFTSRGDKSEVKVAVSGDAREITLPPLTAAVLK
jgi:glycosidase